MTQLSIGFAPLDERLYLSGKQTVIMTGQRGMGAGLVESFLEEGSWRDARKNGFCQTLDFDEE